MPYIPQLPPQESTEKRRDNLGAPPLVTYSSPIPEKAETPETRETGPSPGTKRGPSTVDVDLALRIKTFFEALPGNRSATAGEIAEALFGPGYKLDQVISCYRCCKALEEAKLLIQGLYGYGYQANKNG